MGTGCKEGGHTALGITSGPAGSQALWVPVYCPSLCREGAPPCLQETQDGGHCTAPPHRNLGAPHDWAGRSARSPGPLPTLPTWLSMFGAAPSTALIPCGVFPRPLVLYLAIVQLPHAQRKTPSNACSKQEKLHPTTTASAQKPADGCGRVPGTRTWILLFDTGCPDWLLARPQLPVLPLPVVIC